MFSEEYTRSAAVPGALTALIQDLARAPAETGWSVPAHPGERVGRFEIVRTIGRGGFGVVYEARDLELGRSVALKGIRAGASDDASDRMALAEAEAAAQLAHPGIVHLYELGRCARGAFLVMELLRGESLSARLARGALRPREAVRVALGIARGLAHAHAHGVVHRDLKPANVYLCEDGQVKVLDFGLARVFGRAGVSGGTPDYMAPEQARGEAGDERSDLYALGVVAFELLSGRRPRRPEAPPRAPAALARLVMRLMADEREDRPATAAEACAQLGTIADALAPRPMVRASLAAAGLSVVGAVAFAVLWQRPLPPGRLLTVAADTANSTGDPDLDAVGGFLSLALDQSPRVALVARSRLVNLLAVDGEGAGRIDEAAAGRAARRVGAALLLVPEVAAEGTRLTVGVRVVEVARDEPAFTVRERATGKGSVADAIDRLAARLLGRLGEPTGGAGARIPVGAAVPLDPEAWRHVEAAQRLTSEGREDEAQAEMRQVLATDPENPLAHYGLVLAAEVEGDRPRALRHAEVARRNIARLPAKERALVEAEVALLHGGSDEEWLQRVEQVMTGWPEDPRAYARAGIILLNRDGDIATMRPYLEKAVAVAALRPGLRVSFLAALGRLDEALEAARRYVDRSPGALSYLYLAAAHRWRGEVAEALAAGRRSCQLDEPPASETQRWNFVEADALEELEGLLPERGAGLPHWLALRGRWRQALAALDRQAPDGAAQAGLLGQYRSRRASLLALGVGDAGAVWREVEAQLALGHEGLGCNVLWLALAGDLERAGRLRAAVSPPETAGCVRAYRALELEGRGDREAALARWVGLYGYGSDFHQGQLLLALGRVQEAVEAFRRYRRRPDHPMNQMGMLWSAAFYPRSLYLEAGALVRLGDEAEALRLLGRLDHLWDRADVDAPMAREAEALRARLLAGGRSGGG